MKKILLGLGVLSATGGSFANVGANATIIKNKIIPIKDSFDTHRFTPAHKGWSFQFAVEYNLDFSPKSRTELAFFRGAGTAITNYSLKSYIFGTDDGQHDHHPFADNFRQASEDDEGSWFRTGHFAISREIDDMFNSTNHGFQNFIESDAVVKYGFEMTFDVYFYSTATNIININWSTIA